MKCSRNRRINKNAQLDVPAIASKKLLKLLMLTRAERIKKYMVNTKSHH